MLMPNETPPPINWKEAWRELIAQERKETRMAVRYQVIDHGELYDVTRDQLQTACRKNLFSDDALVREMSPREQERDELAVTRLQMKANAYIESLRVGLYQSGDTDRQLEERVLRHLRAESHECQDRFQAEQKQLRQYYEECKTQRAAGLRLMPPHPTHDPDGWQKWKDDKRDAQWRGHNRGIFG
jgi:hypothetical protein